MSETEIEIQIKFFINKQIVVWSPWKSMAEIENAIKNNDNFIIFTLQEVYTDKLDLLINLLDKFPDKKIYISQSTSTKYKYSTHPIVNLLHFSDKHSEYYNPMKEEVVWQLSKNVIGDQYFGYFNFNDKAHYLDLKKSNKGILSVRKENNVRNYIFSNRHSDIFNKFEGILRYIKITPKFNIISLEDLSEEDIKLNDNPTTSELIKEYCKSFVSFVIETDSENAELNPLTEKTLISFMTQTLPVLYGGKNFIKELSDMGFYTFNEELGFNTDDLDYGDSKKINNFIEMVNNYNKLSYGDIKKIYKTNYNKIKKNYDIVWDIISK